MPSKLSPDQVKTVKGMTSAMLAPTRGASKAKKSARSKMKRSASTFRRGGLG